MSALGSLAAWALPPIVWQALQLADELPEAVAAARVAYELRGPIAAVRAFASATDGALDDAAVAQLESWLASVLGALDTACSVGAWLSEHEPRFRSGVDATLAGVFGAAYQLAAWRDVLRRWQRG